VRARARSDGRPVPAERRSRWLWTLVSVVAVAFKAEALAELLHHRASLIAVLAVAVALSVMRPRPARLAATLPPLLAVTVGRHSLALGAALGFGGFAVLLAAFFAVGTVLVARQKTA